MRRTLTPIIVAVGTLVFVGSAGAEVRVYMHRHAPPCPTYYVYEPLPPWQRPVYVRPYYATPVIVERPIVVEQPAIVVEQPAVAQQPMVVRQPAVIQRTSGEATGPNLTPMPDTSARKPVVQPINGPPPARLASEPTSVPGQPQVVVQEVIEDPPLVSLPAVPVEYRGSLPKGPTRTYELTHGYSGVKFEIQIPENRRIKRIHKSGRHQVKIYYEDDQIEIEFSRDGSAKVKYKF